MISVSHLSKKYGTFEAVKDLSFHLEKGQIYGLLGPNGAGKSTTMNMLTGYLPPTSGEIRIGGYDLKQEPDAAKACIGYLPEIPPLYTDMTVYEYLLTAAQLRRIGRGQIKTAIAEAMERVQITDRRSFLIKNLSKGYRQRVGIAQALLSDPPVIILDEPTVGLDPKQVIEIRELVRSLREKHTVIFSSHILSEVAQVCDHVLILHRGTLAAQGSAGELDRMFSAQRRIRLLAEGEETRIRNILAAEAGVRIEKMDPVQNGQWEILLEAEEERDPRKALFFAFAGAGCPILEMRREAHSLEEIFLSLTEEQTKTGEEDA